MLLHGTGVSGYYVSMVFLLPASTVEGHHVLSLKVLCQKWKPQIDGLVLSVLHILGQEKKNSLRTMLLQTTA